MGRFSRFDGWSYAELRRLDSCSFEEEILQNTSARFVSMHRNAMYAASRALLDHVMVELAARAAERTAVDHRLACIEILGELFSLNDPVHVRDWVLLCMPESADQLSYISVSQETARTDH